MVLQHLTMQFFKKDNQIISDDNGHQQNVIEGSSDGVLLIVLCDMECTINVYFCSHKKISKKANLFQD